MSQTKRGSMVEAIVSNTLSFFAGWFGNMIFLPWFGIHPSWVTGAKIGALFTVVFMFKSYALRRAFNKIKRWNS